MLCNYYYYTDNYCYLIICFLISLIVIASSLKGDSEAKLLRLILALRVKYWTLQPLCGVVSSFHAGYVYQDNIHHTKSVSHYIM